MPWLLGLFALLTVVGLLGSCLIEGRGASPRPLAERWAEAPLLGATLLGATLMVVLVLFDHFAVESVVWLPLGLAMLLWSRKVLSRGRTISTTQPVRSPPWRARDFVFPLVALAMTASMMATAYRGGVIGDYLGIWSFKALVLSEHGSLAIPEFTDDEWYHHHKDYPLLFPCLQALLYRLSGDVVDLTAKLLHPLLLGCTALFLYLRCRRRGGLVSGWVGGGLCLALPYAGGASSGNMDIPLGCFILMAHLASLDWMEDGRPAAAFRAGLFLTAAALTKNEGLVAAAVTVSLLTVFVVRTDIARRGKGLLTLLLPLLLIGGTWYVFRSSLPSGPRNYVHAIFGPDFWDKAQYVPQVVGSFLHEVVSLERWGYLWVLCLVTLPKWFRGDGWVPAVFVGVMAVGYVMALAFSPLEIDYQVNSTVHRLMAQLAPLAAAMVGLALADPQWDSAHRRRGS